MITETSEVAFRQNLADLLNQVHFRGDSIVLNKDGKPIAALADARLFARLRRLQRRFDELSERLAQGFEDVPEEKGLGNQMELAINYIAPCARITWARSLFLIERTADTCSVTGPETR